MGINERELEIRESDIQRERGINAEREREG